MWGVWKAAREFANGSIEIRRDAQKDHARDALEALRQLAISATPDSAKISALREYLEQVLGKPESPPAGSAGEDAHSGYAAYSGMVREKLLRIAHSGTAPEDRERAE